MNTHAPIVANKAVDSIQQRLTEYATALSYERLTPEVVNAAKARVIDTFGALVAGFFGEPCQIARNVAALMPNVSGSTIIGTRMKTASDLAAFVNGTTARYAEMNDFYHLPGKTAGHPSDTLLPVFAAAEFGRVSGREFITAVVLGYEIYQRICDEITDQSFCHTTFCGIATSVAAGKLLKLSSSELAHCISMAVVPNNILRQVRRDHLTMYKCATTGHGGRFGVFAAMLARAGMEGPHLPFEGKAGWCDHVAHRRFTFPPLGGEGAPFKILETSIKNRPSNAVSIASILAAEKVAPFGNIKDITKITVEVFKRGKAMAGTDKDRWDPQSRESADHSIPYVVAVTLMDGTVNMRSFDDAHLWNPQVRELMQKVEVVENDEFTRAYQRVPREHYTRITIHTSHGDPILTMAGGDADDLSAPKSNGQIDEKFRSMAEDLLGAKQVKKTLDQLWNLDQVGDVAEIPPNFVVA